MFFKDIESSTGSLHWAHFFLKLGRMYGSEILKENQIHNMVIKVPYTNYIPHFISLGAADQIYSSPIENSIENVKSKLKPGMLIYYKPTINKAESPYTFLGFTEDGYPIIEDKGKNPTKTKLGIKWETKIRIANEQVKYKKGHKLKNTAINILKDYYPINNLDLIARTNNHRIILIGNEKKILIEAQEEIQNIEFYNWLMMRPFLHQQSYYLTDIYSSKFKGDLNNIPHNTIVIYSSLDAFYNFYDELKSYSSVVLYSPVESNLKDIEVLSSVMDLLDNHESSKIIENAISNYIPKGIELGTWVVEK